MITYLTSVLYLKRRGEDTKVYNAMANIGNNSILLFKSRKKIERKQIRITNKNRRKHINYKRKTKEQHKHWSATKTKLKTTKRQTAVNKTQQRKQKTEQHKPNRKSMGDLRSSRRISRSYYTRGNHLVAYATLLGVFKIRKPKASNNLNY